MDSNTFTESLNKFLRDKLRNVHTIKPAVVTKVTGNRVSVKPLTTTKYHDGTHLPLPVLDDVPLMIYSGQKGKARVTVPVGVGDLVMVLCSDRDTGDLLNSTVKSQKYFLSDEITPLELYPILAIPCFFTIPTEKELSGTDIVVENGTTKITVKPDGNIEMEAEGDVTVNAGGNVDVNSEGDTNIVSEGTVNVSGVGLVTLNAPAGLQVNTSGATFTGPITAPGLFAPIIAPSPADTNLLGHVHFYEDDDGTNTTVKVTDEPLPSGSTPP